MAAGHVDSDGDEITDDEDSGDDAMGADDPMVMDQRRKAGDDSDMDSSDEDASDMEDAGTRGVDKLQVSNGIDIPEGINIPVVSQLAKEAYRREQKNKKAKTAEDMEMDVEDTKRKIVDFIEKDEDELETHFVENPFIKIREKASRKQLDGKNVMGAEDLQEDADTTAQ